MPYSIRASRLFAVIFFAMLAGARTGCATTGEPATMTIHVGESFDFVFTSDFASGNQYSFSIFPNPHPISAVPPSPLPTGKSCTWHVTGLKPGTAHLTCQWDHPSTGGSDLLQCVVTVLAQPESSANDGHIATGGDPVNTRNGELFGVEAIDLNLGGPLPLVFERYYASAIAADGSVVSALGTNRAHNFDVKLATDGTTTATVTTARGRIVSFAGKAGKFTLSSPKDIPYQFVKSGSTYRFADPASQLQFVFDATGKLASIEDGRGNGLTLTYTGSFLTSVSDGLGRTLGFAYDGNGHLTSVGDGVRIVTFTYSGNNLATATDAAAHTTMYVYDIDNLLTGRTRPLGNVPISQAFTGGAVTTQTQRGADTTFDYSANPTVETDPASATQRYTYAANGTLTALTDAAGKSITLGNDATGRWSSVTDRLGHTTTIETHALSGLVAKVTRPDGGATGIAYAARTTPAGLTLYDPAKITFPDGTTRSFTHDVNGNLLVATDELGRKTKFTYNSRGQALTITNALGGVRTFIYDDATGLLTSAQDSDTMPATFSYDAASRLTKITHPDATHRDFSYNAVDRPTSFADERGDTSAYAYDSNNRLTTFTDAATHNDMIAYDTSDTLASFTNRRGKTSAQTFNSRNLVANRTNALGKMTTFGYDTRRRLTTITDPLSDVTTLGYDDEARLTSVTDASGHTTNFSRDVLGLVNAVSAASGVTVSFAHDLRLRPVSKTDPLGRQTRWTYDKAGELIAAARDGLPGASYTRDALGDVTQTKDPNGGVWKFAYTPMGRLKTETDPLGRTMSYDHDSRGRLSKFTGADGSTATLTYNGVNLVTGLAGSDGTALGYGYDAVNRLTGATTGTAANDVALTLDEEGHITRSTQDGFDFDATYDDDGRLATTVSSYNLGHFRVTYQYDAAGRLTSVSDNLTNGFAGSSVTFAYDAAGRTTTATRSNGVITTYTYDAAGRLTRLQDMNGATVVLDLQYTLNAAGEVVALSATGSGVLAPSVLPAAKTFTFDKAAQLVSGTDGNFSYDARGRLTASPAYGFSWDAFSRLKKIADPAAGANDRTLTYDAFGATVTRALGAARTRYFHHQAIGGSPIFAERDDVGNSFTRFYIYTPDGRLLYSIDDTLLAPAHFYHADRNGNVLALTDDGTGAVSDTYAYGPYGELLGRTGTSDQPFRWLGVWGVRTDVLGAPASENAASVFYDLHSRWFDPATARFLSRDPVPPRLTDVATLDPYQYGHDDPLTFIDPFGAQDFAFSARNQNVTPSGIINYGVTGASANSFLPVSARVADINDDDFATPTTTAPSFNSLDVAVGDFNADGIRDIAVDDVFTAFTGKPTSATAFKDALSGLNDLGISDISTAADFTDKATNPSSASANAGMFSLPPDSLPDLAARYREEEANAKVGAARYAASVAADKASVAAFEDRTRRIEFLIHHPDQAEKEWEFLKQLTHEVDVQNSHLR
jgi:RHS repeat-associated protein